jgi:anti-sigma factor RsiW
VGGVRHGCGLTPADLGPYVLGQLGDAERRRVAALLAGCPACSADVARLLPVGAALTAQAAPPPVVAPPLVLDRALEAVHAAAAVRRRRRALAGAAVAAVLLPVLLAALLLPGRAPGGERVALTGPAGTGGVVRVEARGWGSALTLDVHGLAPGRTYGAWLADGASQRVPAGTFRATASGAAHLDLSAALRVPDTRTVGVTEIGGGDVLLGRLGTR